MLRQSQRPQTSHCPFPGCVCTEGGPDGVSGYPPRKLSTFDSEPLRYATHAAQRPPPSSSGPIPPMRSAYTWDDRDREDTGSPHGSSSASASVGGSPARKHARSWDSEVRISLCLFSFLFPARGSLPLPLPVLHRKITRSFIASNFFSFHFCLLAIQLQDPPIRKRRAGSVSRSPPMLVS